MNQPMEQIWQLLTSLKKQLRPYTVEVAVMADESYQPPHNMVIRIELIELNTEMVIDVHTRTFDAALWDNNQSYEDRQSFTDAVARSARLQFERLEQLLAQRRAKEDRRK